MLGDHLILSDGSHNIEVIEAVCSNLCKIISVLDCIAYAEIANTYVKLSEPKKHKVSLSLIA